MQIFLTNANICEYSDALLLADVFSGFKDCCFNAFNLYPDRCFYNFKNSSDRVINTLAFSRCHHFLIMLGYTLLKMRRFNTLRIQI